MNPYCPLCKQTKVGLLQVVSADQVIGQWRESFAIEIASEFKGVSEIRLFQCVVCGLQYFEPQVVGSDRLYARLESYDWYYDPNRWEYTRAMRWIDCGASVLEVGCGRGHFLKTVLAERKACVTGLELNPSAVRQAQAEGLAVEAALVDEFRRKSSQQFDVVSCFQVLEHVPNPGEFIDACVGLLKPGGRFLLSVPNSAGFIRRSPDNVWNQPPHHVTRWGVQSLKYLAEMFPLALAELSYEPLAACHVDWFVNVQLDRIPKMRFVYGPLAMVGRGFVRQILLRLGLRRLFRGHSVFACYQKKGRTMEL